MSRRHDGTCQCRWLPRRPRLLTFWGHLRGPREVIRLLYAIIPLWYLINGSGNSVATSLMSMPERMASAARARSVRPPWSIQYQIAMARLYGYLPWSRTLRTVPEYP